MSGPTGPSPFRRARLATFILSLAGTMALSACGSTAVGRISAPRALRLARWMVFAHVPRPLDVAGARGDGSLVLAAAGRLSLLAPAGVASPFAPGYQSPGGEEPYIALSPGGCFGNGTVYALRLTSGRGVEAIGCRGVATTITRTAPRVEGGIAVAPAGFGAFAGDLIAPGEASGKLFAITPRGRSRLVADSGLPHGNDIGVESEGFVPRDRSRDVFVADRLTPGNPHPGDDVLLGIRAGALRAAGVRPGDLLVTTEGGALTETVRCSAVACAVRLVGRGPAIAHVEGHIAFGRSG